MNLNILAIILGPQINPTFMCGDFCSLQRKAIIGYMWGEEKKSDDSIFEKQYARILLKLIKLNVTKTFQGL